MGLEINRLVKDNDAEHVEATERLCLTEDGRLVQENDAEARWLFCVPGTRIRRSDLERYGLKQRGPSEDKAVHAPEGDKAHSTPVDDELTAARAEAEAKGIKVHPNAKADTIRQKIADATSDPGAEA